MATKRKTIKTIVNNRGIISTITITTTTATAITTTSAIHDIINNKKNILP